ncbi:Pepsin-like aspartic protease a1, partial [Globisporangium splendens]
MTTTSKIPLTRQNPAWTVLKDPARRLDDDKSSVKSVIPLTNYKSSTYLAELLVDGDKHVVLVDTGSSDFWLSCAYVGDKSCARTCPYSATVISYGSGDVCVEKSTATVQVGDLKIKDYVVSTAQGRNMIPNTDYSILSSGTEGLFGLGYASLAAIPNTKAGQFIDHLDSFSIYLTDETNSTGSFLQLNGVDNELIARENMKPYTIPLLANPSHWSIGMTAFQVGNETAQFPCDSILNILEDDSTRCKSIVDTGTTLLFMPDDLFTSFARKYLTPQGCEDASNYVAGISDSLYVCEKSVKLPQLSFTFDDFTFYLNGEDYTMPLDDTELVVIELQSSGYTANSWIIGDTFLKRFYTSYEVNQSVTFYCREGDCAQNVVTNPIEPAPRTPAPSSAKKSGLGSSGSSVSDSSSVSESNSSNSGAVVILAVALAIAGVVLLVGAFLFVRQRKRKAVAATLELANDVDGSSTPVTDYPAPLPPTPTDRV